MSRLRIISGEFGGRFISADVGRATQPMGDRVRSALFNMVDVRGKKVLDAYAGSGAIGLEALSRGAEQVDFVENDKKTQRVIAKNIKILDVDEKAKLYKVSANAFISIAKELGKVYDIVFVDPPYKLYRKQPDGTGDFSTALNLRGLVKPNGLMIISCTTGLCVPTVNGVVVVDKRSYGEAALVVLSFLDDK